MAVVTRNTTDMGRTVCDVFFRTLLKRLESTSRGYRHIRVYGGCIGIIPSLDGRGFSGSPWGFLGWVLRRVVGGLVAGDEGCLEVLGEAGRLLELCSHGSGIYGKDGKINRKQKSLSSDDDEIRGSGNMSVDTMLDLQGVSKFCAAMVIFGASGAKLNFTKRAQDLIYELALHPSSRMLFKCYVMPFFLRICGRGLDHTECEEFLGRVTGGSGVCGGLKGDTVEMILELACKRGHTFEKVTSDDTIESNLFDTSQSDLNPTISEQAACRSRPENIVIRLFAIEMMVKYVCRKQTLTVLLSLLDEENFKVQTQVCKMLALMSLSSGSMVSSALTRSGILDKAVALNGSPGFTNSAHDSLRDLTCSYHVNLNSTYKLLLDNLELSSEIGIQFWTFYITKHLFTSCSLRDSPYPLQVTSSLLDILLIESNQSSKVYKPNPTKHGESALKDSTRLNILFGILVGSNDDDKIPICNTEVLSICMELLLFLRCGALRLKVLKVCRVLIGMDCAWESCSCLQESCLSHSCQTSYLAEHANKYNRGQENRRIDYAALRKIYRIVRVQDLGIPEQEEKEMVGSIMAHGKKYHSICLDWSIRTADLPSRSAHPSLENSIPRYNFNNLNRFNVPHLTHSNDSRFDDLKNASPERVSNLVNLDKFKESRLYQDSISERHKDSRLTDLSRITRITSPELEDTILPEAHNDPLLPPKPITLTFPVAIPDTPPTTVLDLNPTDHQSFLISPINSVIDILEIDEQMLEDSSIPIDFMFIDEPSLDSSFVLVTDAENSVGSPINSTRNPTPSPDVVLRTPVPSSVSLQSTPALARSSISSRVSLQSTPVLTRLPLNPVRAHISDVGVSHSSSPSSHSRSLSNTPILKTIHLDPLDRSVNVPYNSVSIQPSLGGMVQAGTQPAEPIVKIAVEASVQTAPESDRVLRQSAVPMNSKVFLKAVSVSPSTKMPDSNTDSPIKSIPDVAMPVEVVTGLEKNAESLQNITHSEMHSRHALTSHSDIREFQSILVPAYQLMSPSLQKKLFLLLAHLHFGTDPVDYFVKYATGLKGGLFKGVGVDGAGEVVDGLHPVLREIFSLDLALLHSLLPALPSTLTLTTWLETLTEIHQGLMILSRDLGRIERRMRRRVSVCEGMMVVRDRVGLLLRGVVECGGGNVGCEEFLDALASV